MKIFSSIRRHPFLSAVVFVVVFVVVGYSSIGILYSGPHPECGRALDSTFQEYASESRTPVFPNVNGKSDASLKLVEPFFGTRIYRYGYVPGLRCGDSKSLVLLYLKTKTRYTWHADTAHNIFSPKLWKIISPDFLYGGPDTEGGELVTTAEFKRRMQTTLAFLKENQRPNWQAVVAEQTAFLNSIKE